jgi:hypothetical protein
MRLPPKKATPPKAWRRIEGVSRKEKNITTAPFQNARARKPLTPAQRGCFWEAVRMSIGARAT